MASVKVEFRGAERVCAGIRARREGAERGLINGLNKAAQLVNRRAKMLAPVDTGDLRNKIHAESAQKNGDEISASVISSSDHAAFVEFGTGVRGSGSYPYSTKFPLAYSGEVMGQVAQPYLGRALREASAEIQKIVRNSVQAAMKGGK